MADIFGFDKCKLTFTASNWSQPQVVYVVRGHPRRAPSPRAPHGSVGNPHSLAENLVTVTIRIASFMPLVQARVPGARRSLPVSNAASIVSLEASADQAGRTFAPGTLQVWQPVYFGACLCLKQSAFPHFTTNLDSVGMYWRVLA
jgi:hypothetical protein